MEHLDVTIDFETCSLSANAAVMQVALVPWMRDAKEDPFLIEKIMPYVNYVDLRTCVVGGFDFDQETINWWHSQSQGAKAAVIAGDPKPIGNVFHDMFGYLHELKEVHSLSSLFLWCQGMDVDIAILRNLCRKFDRSLDEVMPHTSFRDCRTVILEAALNEARKNDNGIASPENILANPSLAYKLYKELPERYNQKSEAHDALYDAYRSSWLTWQALKWLNDK